MKFKESIFTYKMYVKILQDVTDTCCQQDMYNRGAIERQREFEDKAIRAELNQIGFGFGNAYNTFVTQPERVVQVNKLLPICESKIIQDETRLDVTPTLNQICKVSEEMQKLLTSVNKIIVEPTYSFYEEDFYMVAKSWKELSNKRSALLTNLFDKKEIDNDTVQDLASLSKLNSERQACIDELYKLVNAPCTQKQKELENQVQQLTTDNARLQDTINKMSIHATKYSESKEAEIDHYKQKSELVQKEFDEYRHGYTVENDQRVSELKQRIEDLMHLNC